MLTNEKVLEHGSSTDRSPKSRGPRIAREPTTHLGPAVSSLERRRVQTEVGKRLDRELLDAAQRRLERAAERGKIEREHCELTASILDLSGNIEAAKREGDLMLARAAEQKRGRTPARSLEELQRDGRERWLAMREAQRAKEKAPEKPIEKTPEQVAPSTRNANGRSGAGENTGRLKSSRRAGGTDRRSGKDRRRTSSPVRNGTGRNSNDQRWLDLVPGELDWQNNVLRDIANRAGSDCAMSVLRQTMVFVPRLRRSG